MSSPMKRRATQLDWVLALIAYLPAMAALVGLAPRLPQLAAESDLNLMLSLYAGLGSIAPGLFAMRRLFGNEPKSPKLWRTGLVLNLLPHYAATAFLCAVDAFNEYGFIT